MVDNLVENINSISVDIVAEIEKELDPYDLISLVFLLHDAPNIALQRLIDYESACSDFGSTNMHLLYNWAHSMQMQHPTLWRYEFLEALTICQVNKVIKKLGFNLKTARNHYLPDNVHTCLNLEPMKKALYKLCENLTSSNLERLRNTLKTYDIDTEKYKSAELIILDLMCKKFILLDPNNVGKNNQKYKIDNLAKIIENMPMLQQFAKDLRDIQDRLNQELKPSTSMDNCTSGYSEICETTELKETENATSKDLLDLFDDVSKLTLGEELDFHNLKMDTNKLVTNAYPIKNPKRIGVCYIINQETFHSSKDSLESGSKSPSLDTRAGSSKDLLKLKETMSSLNFEIIAHTNIGHRKMLECIENIVQYRVQHDDSMFMLCIMSHGVRGHVYAADSVKIKIDDIQNLLDEGLKKRDLEIPKIIIIQACQQNDEEETSIRMVADSPTNYLKKLNFIICWATAPELEAYRHDEMGSIFIQVLCFFIKKKAKNEHLYDIFTQVIDGVAKICSKLKPRREQVPIFESTLRKKLYLQMPEFPMQSGSNA